MVGIGALCLSFFWHNAPKRLGAVINSRQNQGQNPGWGLVTAPRDWVGMGVVTLPIPWRSTRRWRALALGFRLANLAHKEVF